MTNRTYLLSHALSRSLSSVLTWIPLPLSRQLASKPNCVSAQLIWQHGTYILNSNNTLTLDVFKGDGRQQISDRCAQVSNVVQSYDQKEEMQGFEIHKDVHFGKPVYSLKLYQFNGEPKPLMYQVYDPPQMLPTEQLHQQVIGELNAPATRRR